MSFAGNRSSRLLSRLAAVLVSAFSLAATADSAIVLPVPGGSPLVVDAPATRIVTLAPHLAELVFLAGAGDRLLATVAYSDHPPAAASLPRIGDAFRFDLEQIMALKPDLVIAWSGGNPEAALATMEQLGLPVWRTDIDDIPAMAMMLRTLGTATDLDTEALALAVERRWNALQARYRGEQTLRYFYQVAERPLYTVNGRHLISTGLDACGAINVFATLPTLAPQVSRESVLQENPDVILAGRAENAEDPLAHWRDWPRLTAVREDALFTLPADLINRATPRMLDAIEEACVRLDEHRTRLRSAEHSP